MRNTLIMVSLFACIISNGCTMQEPNNEKIVDQPLPARKDAFHQLCQYWEVTDAERPTFRDLYDHQDEGVYNYPGIVFLTDSSFLENPRAEMRYGKFTFTGKEIDAQFDDGQKVVYSIQDKQPLTMIVKRAEKDHSTVLYLKASNVFWPDPNANPYSKVNSQWRFRPGKPESNEELRERLKGCVKFYELFFKGHSESESNEIDFLGLPTCFKWYQGGIFVQSAKTLDKKWINCFYSEDQAQQARQMMQDVLSKKYDWDTTQRNWVKQHVPILKQVQNQF